MNACYYAEYSAECKINFLELIPTSGHQIYSCRHYRLFLVATMSYIDFVMVRKYSTYIMLCPIDIQYAVIMAYMKLYL